MQTVTTLRPGLLVSLKTSIRGNVSYAKRILEANHTAEDGAEKERWETERRIANPQEYDRAREVRSKASSLIRSVCAHSAFGLLCPESEGEELSAAIASARALAEEFNATAELSQVSVYVITGRVAADDVEAVRAINSEVRDLMGAMAAGVEALDVKAIREAADKARQLGSMLSPMAEARVKIAIDTARQTARRIVQAGETAAREIDMGAVRKITEMRTTFLETEAIAPVQAPEAAAGRGVDLDATSATAAPSQPTFNLEV